jgi:hypothetical protein
MLAERKTRLRFKSHIKRVGGEDSLPISNDIHQVASVLSRSMSQPASHCSSLFSLLDVHSFPEMELFSKLTAKAKAKFKVSPLSLGRSSARDSHIESGPER